MFSDLGIFYNAPKNTSLFKIIIDNKMYTHKFLFSGFLPTKPNSESLVARGFSNYDVPGIVPAIMSTVLQLGGLT